VNALSYILLPSAFGTLGVVWGHTPAGPRVHRVALPDKRAPTADLIQVSFAGASPGSCPPITQLGQRLQRFLEGEALRFELDLVALESCSDFQRRVLLAEHRIPRGWVSTYGGIAKYLGKPGGARAVGGALAHNPFPIIVPCHRAVRSDGQLGGFQGGQEMKRALLEFEGVVFSPTGRVLTDRVYY